MAICRALTASQERVSFSGNSTRETVAIALTNCHARTLRVSTRILPLPRGDQHRDFGVRLCSAFQIDLDIPTLATGITREVFVSCDVVSLKKLAKTGNCNFNALNETVEFALEISYAETTGSLRTDSVCSGSLLLPIVFEGGSRETDWVTVEAKAPLRLVEQSIHRFVHHRDKARLGARELANSMGANESFFLNFDVSETDDEPSSNIVLRNTSNNSCLHWQVQAFDDASWRFETIEGEIPALETAELRFSGLLASTACEHFDFLIRVTNCETTEHKLLHFSCFLYSEPKTTALSFDRFSPGKKLKKPLVDLQAVTKKRSPPRRKYAPKTPKASSEGSTLPLCQSSKSSIEEPRPSWSLGKDDSDRYFLPNSLSRHALNLALSQQVELRRSLLLKRNAVLVERALFKRGQCALARQSADTQHQLETKLSFPGDDEKTQKSAFLREVERIHRDALNVERRSNRIQLGEESDADKLNELSDLQKKLKAKEQMKRVMRRLSMPPKVTTRRSSRAARMVPQ